MRRSISYVRLGFLPVLLLALLIQLSCSESERRPGSAAQDTVRTAAAPDTARPLIEKPSPDATIIDSLTHDFGGVWIADSVLVPQAVSATEGMISFCTNGHVTYRVFGNGPVVTFRAKQVWIDRQHVHVDLFLEELEGAEVDVPEAAMPVKGKLFATGDLVSNTKMTILWYPRDFINAVRQLGSPKSPEAFPAAFYYTTRKARCN